MPTYVYRCEEDADGDDHVTELFRMMADRHDCPACSTCGKPTYLAAPTRTHVGDVDKGYVSISFSDHGRGEAPRSMWVKSKRHARSLEAAHMDSLKAKHSTWKPEIERHSWEGGMRQAKGPKGKGW